MVIKKKMKKKKPKQSKELKLSFKKITNFTSQSINKVYKNFLGDLNDVLATKKVKFFQLRFKNMSKYKIIQYSISS